MDDSTNPVSVSTRLREFAEDCEPKHWSLFRVRPGTHRSFGTPHFVHESLDARSTVIETRPSVNRPWVFFCDWHPQLFGIDEDDIPSSDEEGPFDVDWDDLEEKATALSDTVLKGMRKGPLRTLNDEELRNEWKKDRTAVYPRRERIKPTYKNDKNEPFDCTCNVDYHYSRMYIPHFGGIAPGEGEKLRTPHFVSFWESYRERDEFEEMEGISKAFNEIVEEPEPPKGVKFRPTPIFADLSRNKIQEFRKQLLARFRPLSCREIRRYRIPYADALYLELQEDNYADSAAFFKYLIIKDYFLHLSPDNPGPCLRDFKNMMNIILEFLKLAEKFSRNGEYHKEALVLLRGGLYIRDHDQKWWWLAEEFYRKAVKASEHSVLDGGKSEAVANYILGTFLLDSVQKVQLAQAHLLRALELSKGKDWSAKTITQKHQETIHKECTNHLCRALIAASKELRKNGKPEEALPLIYRSHKLCEESKTERWDIELETYFELGMTYQDLELLDWAKTAFKKFIELAKGVNFSKSICDGYLESAICYKSEGDLDRCHRQLYSYLLAAKQYQSENLMAFGTRYLGEFHLHNGHPDVALDFLKTSFRSFLEQYISCSDIPFEKWEPEHFTLSNDVELTRVLTGLAKGEKYFRPICNAICLAKTQQGLLNLIQWKNTSDAQHLNALDRSSGKKLDLDVTSLGDSSIDMSMKTVRFSVVMPQGFRRSENRSLF